MEVLFKRSTDVCLKQEVSIGCLLLMLCLDGSVTLFTLGGVDILVSKKFKSVNGRGQSPTSALLRRRLKPCFSTVQNAKRSFGSELRNDWELCTG